MPSIATLERDYYISRLGLPADTDMTLNDLRHAYFSNPPAAGGGASFESNVGNGTLTTIPIAHSLGTLTPSVTVIDNSDNTVKYVDWVVVDDDNINLVFPQAPATDEFRVAVRA